MIRDCPCFGRFWNDSCYFGRTVVILEEQSFFWLTYPSVLFGLVILELDKIICSYNSTMGG